MNALFIPGGFIKNQKELIRSTIKTLGKVVSDFVVIDFYKTNKLKEICLELNIKVISFDKFDTKHKPSFLEEEFKNFLIKNNIKNVFIIRPPLNESFKRGRYNRIKNLFKLFDENKEANRVSSFETLESIFRKCLMMKVCCEVCDKVIQLAIDPQESLIEEWVQFVLANKDDFATIKTKYTLSSKKDEVLKYAPFYELGLFDNFNDKSIVKELIFFFACGATYKTRFSYVNVSKDFDEEEGFFFKAFTSTKDMISQDEYYEFLKRSKFTLIIKSFEESTFSIIRFLESLKFNCIPLVEEDVCLDDLFNTFPDIYEKIQKWGLVVKLDKDSIKNKINELDCKRNDIIDDFLYSESLLKITNEDKLKRFYRRLLNV